MNRLQECSVRFMLRKDVFDRGFGLLLLIWTFIGLLSSGACLNEIWATETRVVAQVDVPQKEPITINEKPEPTKSKKESEEKKDSDEIDKLPTLEALIKQLPPPSELMSGKPFDWVLLKAAQKPVVKGAEVVREVFSPRVLAIEPIFPRPNALEDLEKRRKDLRISPPSDPKLLSELREKQRLAELLILILKGDASDAEYSLETRLVERIMYFEDILLLMADKALDKRDLSAAQELIWFVERRQSNWPGIRESQLRLLMVDATVRRSQGKPEESLALLEELLDREPRYPQAIDEFAITIEELCRSASVSGQPRRFRHFLGRLEVRNSQHPTYKKLVADREEAAQELVRRSKQSTADGNLRDAALLVDEATRVWPLLGNLRETHKETWERYQIVRLGDVIPMSEKWPYPFSQPLEERRDQLVRVPWFEPREFSASQIRFYSRFFEEWEPDDLGRKLHLTLRSAQSNWEACFPLKSSEVIEQLRSMIDSTSGQEDERLSDLISHVGTRNGEDIDITFRQAPLRPESLLWHASQTRRFGMPRFELLPEDKARDETSTFTVPMVSQSRFVRVRSQPGRDRNRRVAELDWRMYRTWEETLQALVRGEIHCALSPALYDVSVLKDDPRFFVTAMQSPVNHFIQLNPSRSCFRQPELRRALQAAIPRADLLKWQVIRQADEKLARLAATTVPVLSTSCNRQLLIPEHDLHLATSLSVTLRKRNSHDLPELRLACPQDLAAIRVCRELIREWKRAGLSVRFLEATDPPDEWDLCYRMIRSTDAWTEMWPLLVGQSTAKVQPLIALSQGIRQRLIDLERAPSWNVAQSLLHRLQADVLADAWVFPLWEVDEFWISRRNLVEVPATLRHPFDGIERWVVQSSYSTEVP